MALLIQTLHYKIYRHSFEHLSLFWSALLQYLDDLLLFSLSREQCEIHCHLAETPSIRRTRLVSLNYSLYSNMYHFWNILQLKSHMR